MKKLFYTSFILFSAVSMSAMVGCTLTPAKGTPTIIADIEKFNATVQTDLQKINPILLTVIEPTIEKTVDLGLAMSGNGELIPLNDAGASAIMALQQSIVANSGITQDVANTITNAASLGLKLTNNSKLIPYTASATAVIANLVNASNTVSQINK